jgi:hypothetical protein
MHYFRAPESQDHNAMLLTTGELAAIDQRIIPIEVGDRVALERTAFQLQRQVLAVSAAVRSRVVRDKGRTPQDLERAGTRFVDELGRRFLRLTWLIPPLPIHVTDWRKDIVLHLRRGVLLDPSGDEPVIEAHPQALFDWWSEPYGTDGFFVGAHFRLLRPNMRGLRLLFLAALLKENNLSLRDAIRMLLRPAGWRFFHSRREEIAAVILGLKMRTGVRQ